MDNGERVKVNKQSSYSSLVVNYLIEKINCGAKNLVAINAAIPGMFDLDIFKMIHPNYYFDVGIAEAHSVSFAAGLAKNGIRPILFHSSYYRLLLSLEMDM